MSTSTSRHRARPSRSRATGRPRAGPFASKAVSRLGGRSLWASTQTAAPGSQRVVQRQAADKTVEAVPHLDEILPRGLGPVAHHARLTQLLRIYGAEQLTAHVRLIRASPEATALTQQRGVPALAALFDTRRGDTLDVEAAKRALSTHPGRFRTSSLRETGRLPRREAPPTFWFQDPAAQTRDEDAADDLPISLTAHEGEAKVYIEKDLSTVGPIAVRFAYAQSNLGSARIHRAKMAVLEAIQQLDVDVGSLPPASSRAERLRQKTERAKLGEVLRRIRSKSPLNVYIATEGTSEEVSGAPVMPTTERVFISEADLKDPDPARVQAAIRLPFFQASGNEPSMVTGKEVDTEAERIRLKRAVLHESLHVLLSRQSSDAHAVWESIRPKVEYPGTPYARSRFEELVRKFLQAQEETFAWAHETGFYGPDEQSDAIQLDYRGFAVFVEALLIEMGLRMQPTPRPIRVQEKVGGKRVEWKIIYRTPSGTAQATVKHLEDMEKLLGRREARALKL